MRLRESGHTLIELIVYLGLVSVGLSVGLTLYGTERLTSRNQEEVHRDAAAASAILHELAADLRIADRVVPREGAPGVLVFRKDGTVAAWFDRRGRPGEIHRKVLGKRDAAPGRVVGRGVTTLTVDVTGPLVTARVTVGNQVRSITVRMRHAS